MLIAGLITLSCLGYGCIWLSLLGVTSRKIWAEKVGVAFALGIGTIGWILFWPGVYGWLSQGLLWTILVPGWIGVLFRGKLLIKGKVESFNLVRGKLLIKGKVESFNYVTSLLVALILVSCFFDFIEALSPPTDADSLAYHFALPKQFLDNGQIAFAPIAVQGAIPLMMHLTYLINLGLGGELGLTMWCFVTQLMTCLALYGVGRRWLSRNLSLTLMLVFMTTPAVIYGGGTGQLEVRTALFMLIGAVAASDSVKQRHLGLVVLAGLMAGFFMGSKYLGLFAGIGLFSVVILQRNWFRPAMIFTVATLISGAQWYGWTWWHSGTPVFPIEFPFIGSIESVYWNEDLGYYFNELFKECLPVNVKGVFIYPLISTFGFTECSGHLRTGLGLFVWLLFPGIILGLWRRIYKKRYFESPLVLVVIPGVLYYLLWFFIPTDQSVRHLLPIYPLALLAAVVAVRYGLNGANSLFFVSAGAIFSITIGLFAHAVVAWNYGQFFVSQETRSEFLERNVGDYQVVEWINSNLSREDRVANTLRHLNYFLDVPYLFTNSVGQAQLEIHPMTNFHKFREQIRKENISYIIRESSGRKLGDDSLPPSVLDEFFDSEHSRYEVGIQGMQYSSRTLRVFTRRTIDIFKVLPSG